LLPRGDYEIISDEERIEGISFRRVTILIWRGVTPHRSSIEMVSIS
jgi:hypothetical protein